MTGHYGATGIGTIATFCLALTLSVTALPPSAAAQAHKVFCALVPHFKDEYWLSVGFGLEQEAQRNNTDILFFEAGGYGDPAVQIDQLETCVTRGVDAILIGAVASDHNGLTEAIERAARDVPVFGLVNAVHSDALAGRVGVDWRDMGYLLGQHLSTLHPAGSPAQTAVLVTGPAGSGWTGPLEAGLREGLARSSVTILDVLGADTGLRHQLALSEQALERHPGANYLIGSAPAIEAALGLLATRPHRDKPVLVATYVNHTVKRGLMNASVLAASFDDPMVQARMAIKMAASAPARSAQTLGPKVVVLTNSDDNLTEVRMSPADYFPALQ
ncbi:TMAO reductase system periplasmic protein TorT [Roseobacter denitrificans]|nr:TMAO reductase system periplasmic protein TorT [Roseobacter denitrificans]